jgi:hypothetical protein
MASVRFTDVQARPGLLHEWTGRRSCPWPPFFS